MHALKKQSVRSRLYADITITPSSIKELREKCGAGFLDCKKALIESGGDVKNAIDLLRKQGVILAAKKGHRVTSSGLIGSAVSADGTRGYLVEVNTETDFVAKNDVFIGLVSNIAAALARSPSEGVRNVADISNLIVDGQSVKNLVIEAIAKTGEFISIQRMVNVNAPSPGFVTSYTHGAGSDNLGKYFSAVIHSLLWYGFIINASINNSGKIGVLVGIRCEDCESAKIMQFGRYVGMHIAAQSPDALQISDIDPESLQRYLYHLYLR